AGRARARARRAGRAPPRRRRRSRPAVPRSPSGPAGAGQPAGQRAPPRWRRDRGARGVGRHRVAHRGRGRRAGCRRGRARHRVRPLPSGRGGTRPRSPRVGSRPLARPRARRAARGAGVGRDRGRRRRPVRGRAAAHVAARAERRSPVVSERTRSWTNGVACALVACGLLAACGVQPDRTASVENDRNVPFDLLDRSASTAPATTVVDRTTDVYLVDGDHLRAVHRPATSDPAALVAALVQGPTADEGTTGLRTAVLGPAFTTVNVDQQILALGQLVFTLTSLPGVNRVRFQLDGETTKVTRADGSTVTGAVSRADYDSLLA